MDKNTRAIARFAAALRFEDLTPSAVHACIRHHLDGIGCAAGAFAADPCRIAREIAGATEQPGGCSVFGLPKLTTPEYAAFANGSAVRHLDFNDTYLAGKGGGGHPNDMAPAILAAVEMVGGSGRDLIAGLYTAYEIYGAISNAIRLRARGIEQGIPVSLGTAAAVGRILGLDEAGIANAIAMAIVPCTPVRVTRAGELSHWKGCATAHASMTAMFAARLAQHGMSGPSEPFSGVDGFCNLAAPFELEGVGELVDGKSMVETTSIKYFPAEFNSQGPITALLELRNRFDLRELETLTIASYHLTWHEIGGGQGDAREKWDPATRESADHSLPYLAAIALVDGQVTNESFAPARVRDPALRPLMQKIAVVEDAELSAHWKATSQPKSRLTLRLKDGRVIEDTVVNFRGHPSNPMTDEEVQFKFDSMIGYVLPAAEAKRMRDMLWQLDALDDVRELTGMMRAWSEPGRQPH
jgi:2-methylcitrate dehydratase